MSTHADKTQDNKSKSVSVAGSQMQGSDEAFQVEDNRAQAVTQRKLQEMANNSPQASKLNTFQAMANCSPQIRQAAQLQAMADSSPLAQQQKPSQKKENNTGLPDNLKSGIENLSGYSMDDVKVHRNSDKPLGLQAHAYAQGTDIHLGPGQEKHLPHEAWHVVQQKQGRVKPTMQMKPQSEHSSPHSNGTYQLRLVDNNATLEGDVKDTQSITGNANLTLAAVLNQIATNYQYAAIPATEGALITLLTAAPNPVLDREDIDFLKLKIASITRSQAHADQNDAARVHAFGQQAQADRATNDTAARATAMSNLSRKHSHGIQQSPNNPKHAPALAALTLGTAVAAAPGLLAINNQLAQDIQHSQQVTKPLDYQNKKQQYDAFLVATNQHPLSFQALDFANNHFVNAQNIIAAIVLNAPLLQLLTDPASSLALWNNCNATLTLPTTAAILGRISIANLISYNGVAQGLELLHDLHAQAGIANLKLQQVATNIGSFDDYAPNAAARTALAGLLVNHTVADLQGLFAAMTMVGLATQKPGMLATLRPRAATPADLLAGITLAGQVRLNQAELGGLMATLPLGSAQAAITGRINTRTLATIDKNNEFVRWIGALDGLIATSGFTLSVPAASTPMSGINTFQREITVLDAGGTNRGGFVVHYHPGVPDAAVGNANASPRHIKPVHGNLQTPKMFWSQIPANVLGYLPRNR